MTSAEDILRSAFPKNFLWGAATASYQVEGGIENNDWAKAARQRRLPVCGKATDHYRRYEADFDIAKSLGQNAHRFSIEWSRIEPEEGKFDEHEILHYRQVIRALRARGLEPFVTLWHFTVPIWFEEKGGFGNPKAPEIFARYCAYVIGNLGDEARYWMTMNEPLIWANAGYVRGTWPPFQKNYFTFLRILETLSKAHIAAYDAMKQADQRAKIGIAKHNMFFDSDAYPWNKVASKIATWFWNRRFLNKIKRELDFIGLNYYIHKRFGAGPVYPKTEMGWDIAPEGLLRTLVELKRYGKPVYVTENGIADASDTKRADFILGHVGAVQQAIDQGVSVRGYFYWSLLDNFEWSFGFEKRFGLVEINYETQERIVRPSALVYKKIAEQNSL